MRIFKHVLYQPFIVATGLAALVHSTWGLATLFGGQQPEGWLIVGWITPALLIAFALDVGQIATSAEIRQHGLTVGRGVTFFVFAAATYYLQWLYIAHHMPALQLGAGVSDMARTTAVYMRDAAVWIIPAFLPLSTVLYTFSGKTTHSLRETPNPVEIKIDSAEAELPKPRAVEISSIEAPQEEAPVLPFAVNGKENEGSQAESDNGYLMKPTRRPKQRKE
jgi:hypothetical protein